MVYTIRYSVNAKIYRESFKCWAAKELDNYLDVIKNNGGRILSVKFAH